MSAGIVELLRRGIAALVGRVGLLQIDDAGVPEHEPEERPPALPEGAELVRFRRTGLRGRLVRRAQRAHRAMVSDVLRMIRSPCSLPEGRERVRRGLYPSRGGRFLRAGAPAHDPRNTLPALCPPTNPGSLTALPLTVLLADSAAAGGCDSGKTQVARPPSSDPAKPSGKELPEIDGPEAPRRPGHDQPRRARERHHARGSDQPADQPGRPARRRRVCDHSGG